MTTRMCVLFCAIAATFCASSSVVQAEFIPIAGFDQHLFPSYLIATANLRVDKSTGPHRLGDPTGLLGIEVISPGKNTSIQVIVECDEYLEKSTFSGTLPEANETYRVTPKIKYRYDRLAQCTQAAPTNVTFRIRMGQAIEEEMTVTCTVRSINDCAYAFHEGDQVIDASYSFAAYVNEQHPFVDKLLREALDRGVVNSFHGHQSGKPEDTIRQVYAIWDVLWARDIRYSNITTTAVESESVSCQHVRLIENSINNSQANCVDGSVLMVSLLRKIGIDAFLVMTEDHCYTGFYLDSKRDNLFAIETTLLNDEDDFESVPVPEILNNAVPENDRFDESFAGFVAAIELGTKTYNESVGPKSKSGEVQMIDIAKMRKAGVLPIPFQGNEKFNAFDFTSSNDDDSEEDESEKEDHSK